MLYCTSYLTLCNLVSFACLFLFATGTIIIYYAYNCDVIDHDDTDNYYYCMSYLTPCNSVSFASGTSYIYYYCDVMMLKLMIMNKLLYHKKKGL